MIEGLCGVGISSWQVKLGGKLARVQLTYLQIPPELIAAQSIMVYCQRIIAQWNVPMDVTKPISFVTVELGPASSSLASQKQGLACAVLPDAENMVDALLNILEAKSQ
jgi:hypothetical protein